MSVKAISPEGLADQKKQDTPDWVIETWNKMIAKHYAGNQSEFTVTQLMDALMEDCEDFRIERYHLSRLGYLDLEPLYEENGWAVKFHRPDYTESWESYFTFSKKRSR